MAQQTEGLAEKPSWEWPGWLTAVIIAAVVGVIALVLALLIIRAPLWVTAGILGGITIGITFATFSFALAESGACEQWKENSAIVVSILAGIAGVVTTIWLGSALHVHPGTHVATPILFAIFGVVSWVVTFLFFALAEEDRAN